MNAAILSQRLTIISPALLAELDYYINDVEHEDTYTICDALDDYLTLVLGGNPNAEVKRILIECGYCIPVDITKIITTGGKKYWFIYDKQHYDCVTSWEDWINN